MMLDERATAGSVATHDGLPAINVKVYGVTLDTDAIRTAFHCTEELAQQALEYAFDSACEDFWCYWQETRNAPYQPYRYDYFPDYEIEVFRSGRSGGWLVVSGLPPIGEWSASLHEQWSAFVGSVEADIRYRISEEQMIDAIDANDWAQTRLLAELTEVQ